MEPCVISVDESSVDSALVTALLRRFKYRGGETLHVCLKSAVFFLLILLITRTILHYIRLLGTSADAVIVVVDT